MRPRELSLLALGLAVLAAPAGPVATATPPDADAPRIYVPYQDVPSLLAPADRAVLMDRPTFERLLAAAEARRAADDQRHVAQIARATYAAEVRGDALHLSGTLSITSLTDEPVAVPLRFAQVGLSAVTLDGKAAPLGYDRQGRLVLVVAGRGEHALAVRGSALLKELAGGGIQFGLNVPPAVAGEMSFSAPGDLEVHATVPVAASKYEKQADRTDVKLTLGGHDAVTVVLMGNGRQEDQRAILLGNSALTVQLTAAHQTMHCLYTVQVLRRGVRELTFDLPADWTVTDVSCPALVRWSVAEPAAPGEPQRLLVRLRTASRGTKALHVEAGAPRAAQAAWTSPFVRLQGADFQQGYLLVDAGRELAVRGQQLLHARREDLARAALVPGLLAAGQGRLFYHWADDWSVRLDLAGVELRRSCEARQRVVVSPEELSLLAEFDVTAIGREMFDLAFMLPPEAAAWHVQSVAVNGSQEGFEYHVADAGAARTLKIALASPVRAEGVARIAVALRHVPTDWSWPAGAAPREVGLPILLAEADSLAGQVSVAPAGDLDVAPAAVPEGLEEVTVGRMAALGVPGDVQLAYTYQARPAGALRVTASRRTHRLAADAVGLVTAAPAKLLAAWRITYDISRAQARTLYLLADKALGRTVTIEAAGAHLSGKNIVQPGRDTVELPDALAQAYDLWELTLDSPVMGQVIVDVRYDRPAPGTDLPVPLVRPIGAAQITEMLAVQASEELAVTVTAKGAGDVDAIDLPPLPAPASRLLRAFRLEAPTGEAGAVASVRLATKVHEKYAIPAALAAEAAMTTCLGPRGSQQTEAVFRVANAGLQFLAIRLPVGAELWSVKVAGQPAKPKRNAAGDYLVALPRAAETQEVRVLFALPDAVGGMERLALGRAILPDVKLNRLSWHVVPPPGWQVSRQYTDMQADAPFRPKLAGLNVLDGLKEVSDTAAEVLGAVTFLGAKRISQRLGHEGYEQAAPDGLEEDWSEEPMPAAGARPDEGRSRALHIAGGVVMPPRVARKPAEKGDEAAKTEDAPADKRPSPQAPRRMHEVAGRYTLPIELAGLRYAGPRARFSALGDSDLEIGLVSRTDLQTTEWLGLAAALFGGLLLVRRPAGAKAGLVVLLLAVTTLAAIWWPEAAYAANGAFLGALWLIPAYLAIGLLRWVGGKVRRFAPRPSPAAAATTAAVIVAVVLLSAAAPAWAGGQGDAGEAAGKAAGKPAPVAPPTPAGHAPLIVPYEGDPTQADRSDKVLVPYARYVELWNLAHPDEKIDVPPGPVEVSLAGVGYAAVVEEERLTLTLTARVKTLGKGAAVLPLPMGGLAVTAAELDGKPARLQVGEGGMILTLPGEADGLLKIVAVTTPKTLGRRGSAELSLPPLPAAVMTVDLPERDLELEVPGVEGALTRVELSARGEGGAQREFVRYTVPLGMQRAVTLKWSPKVGLGAADRTLSAAVAHDVFAFHWAIVGVSKVTYTFSAGQNERFGLLLPEGLTLTDLSGANLRDFRETGQTTQDGEKLKVIEVRLHRPATKAYELTARWVGKLPALDMPVRLALPRAAEVGRESGTVVLHAAGGMALKVQEVLGGRRSDAAPRGKPSAREDDTEVARYYWPYRPFALTVQLARFAATPQARLDQLVRIDRRQVQLLVQARLSAERGQLFGASFALPDGYELLSAVGPAVEDHYEQPTPQGRRLHVNFRSGVAETQIALVLLRKGVELGDLPVPAVAALGPDGAELADQSGRLAVQVAASLDAQTVGSENLRAVPPRQLAGWLGDDQIGAVQFAYRYDKPRVSLRLKVSPQPTKVRVEVFGGLTVQETSAWYSCRLRYQIEGTPIDQVTFTLPTRYAPLVAVSSPALRSVTKQDLGEPAGRTEWTVSLVHEVTGTLDVTANFAVPVEATTRLLDVPRIVTAAPEGYRAIVAVQNASRHKLQLRDAQRLAAVPHSEQASLLPEPVRRNLQFVLQSFTDDWSCQLDVTPAEPAARVEAVVDLLALETVIDPAGRCRYEARLTLQNRTQQFLRVGVPEGLKLWSAVVAEQPVKPVTDAAAGAGVVLIPLVKTSPGGLPYDVKLYLAGEAAQPLGLMTELRPPAVRIEGIPVERTTWSLRLPKGYRYLRPGGNLSPLVSSMDSTIVAIETRLGQLRRLYKSYDELSFSSSARGKDVAVSNLVVFNKKVEWEIAQARQEVESNRRDLADKDYDRLKQQLDVQSSRQHGMLGVWNDKQRTEGGWSADNNVNWYVNADAYNGGVAEITRNGSLNAMPEFVRIAAAGQKEQINQEIAGNEAILNAPDAGPTKMGAGKLTLSGGREVTVAGTLDLGGQQILTEGEEDGRVAQVAQVLGKLQEEQHRQQKNRQDELKYQLSQLGDNRLERYYTGLAQQQGQAQAAPGGQASGQVESSFGRQQVSLNGGLTGGGTQRMVLANGAVVTVQPGQQDTWSYDRRAPQPPAGPGSGQAGAQGGPARLPSGAQPQVPPPFTGRPSVGGAGRRGEPAREGTVALDDSSSVLPGDRLGSGDDADPGALAGGYFAVARGTFSLPVALPAGGVQWDFQGPTGEPSITILAVDERLIDGAHNTGAVAVIVLVAWLLGRLVCLARRRAEGAGGFLTAYVVLAAVLAGLVASAGMGVLGAIVLFGAVVCPIELIHRLLARRAARVAA